MCFEARYGEMKTATNQNIQSREQKGKSVLQVPDVHEYWTMDNWRSSIVCFWMQPARSKERKYHILRQYQKYSSIHQYWDVPVSET